MVSSADLSSLSIPREPGTSSSRRRPFWKIALAAAVIVLSGVAAAFVFTRESVVQVRTVTAALSGGAGGGGGLTANGYVVARTKASVSSKVPGRLVYLGVEEGSRVAAGQVIARLEAAEFQAIVRQASADMLAAEAAHNEATAQVTQTRRALARTRALRKDSLVAEQSVEEAATALDVAEARLRATAARIDVSREQRAAYSANLENTVIRAPFSGTVLRKDAEVGEVVAPAVAGGGLTRGAVVTIADLSTLEVEVDINEAYISGIRQGQPAEIVLDAYPSENFRGHVRQVVPTADRQKATVLVRVAIDSKDARILPEMGARVVFTAPEGNQATTSRPQGRVLVPAATVRSEGGKDVVWIIADGRAQKREVDAGPVMGNEREVRRGLSGGEVLIVDPPAGLIAGARVKPMQQTSGKESK